MSNDFVELDPRESDHHPRHQYALIGHNNTEQTLVDAYKSGKFHHAWMLCGPRGIGKATLAFRLARFVLANPDYMAPELVLVNDLFTPPDHPTSRRIAARGHSDLFVLQREINPKTKKLRPAIRVEDARKVGNFFQKTAGEGGWRVCIIDAADDLNTASANAILKILEEPPQKCLFIIIAHNPGKLLPTIRSRCLRLDVSPLKNRQVAEVLQTINTKNEVAPDRLDALINLSNGSPGQVIQLATSTGARQFIRFLDLSKKPGNYDQLNLHKIADEFQKRGAEAEFNIFADLMRDWIANNAKQAALSGQIEHANALSLCHTKFSDSIAATNALNLNRRQTLMMAFDEIEKILVAG